MGVILICVAGCKKYKLEKLVKGFEGNYKMSGTYYATGIGIDTPLIIQNFTDTIISITAYNQTSLNIGNLQCTECESCGPSNTFSNGHNDLWWVTATFYSSDSLIFTSSQITTPRVHTFSFRGKKED